MDPCITRLSRVGGLAVAFVLAAPPVHANAAAPAMAAPATAAGCDQRRPSRRAACERARAADLQAAIDKAQVEREAALERVRPLIVGGRHEQAAGRLREAALTYDDPVLYLEAADQFLAAAGRRRLGPLTDGRAAVDAARALLAATGDPGREADLDVRAARISADAVDALTGRADELQRAFAARERQLRGELRGRQELGAGAGLLAVGLTGVGVLAGGLVYRAAGRRELDAIAGHEAEYDLGALDDQGRRADAMIGAGAVIGAIGVALGATLLGLGARDLRRPARPGVAALRVAPTLGGLVLGGRF